MTVQTDELISFSRPLSGSDLDHFGTKLVADDRILGFDLSPALPEGVTLLSATVSVTASQYSDIAPTAILNGPVGVDTQTGIATVPVTQGEAGVFYVITVTGTTTSMFYQPSMSAVLPVI